MNLFLKSTPGALITLLAFSLLLSCNDRNDQRSGAAAMDTPVLTTHDQPDSIILGLTRKVLTAVKEKDYKTFIGFFHPVSGVRFSPYAHIDSASDVSFSAASFLHQLKHPEKINWGRYDGTGTSIMLTIQGYLSKFVYDADFLKAEKKSVDKPIAIGNSLNNLEEVYKGCHYSESYFSGFDKKLEGMDWRSLRLVFKKYHGRYYLVGVVHDQWTI